MAVGADRPCDARDQGSSVQNLETLDTYIQNTLSALYPPFEATAVTVLWQVFSVAERLHEGDRLRCLTDFLIPPKRALQHLQLEACPLMSLSCPRLGIQASSSSMKAGRCASTRKWWCSWHPSTESGSGLETSICRSHRWGSSRPGWS